MFCPSIVNVESSLMVTFWVTYLWNYDPNPKWRYKPVILARVKYPLMAIHQHPASEGDQASLTCMISRWMSSQYRMLGPASPSLPVSLWAVSRCWHADGGLGEWCVAHICAHSLFLSREAGRLSCQRVLTAFRIRCAYRLYAHLCDLRVL